MPTRPPAVSSPLSHADRPPQVVDPVRTPEYLSQARPRAVGLGGPRPVTARGFEPGPGLPSPLSWWRSGVVYQVFLPSFADGDGDGVGDLPGLTGKLTYLRGLGVDAIWLAPFYCGAARPNARIDEVTDHRQVDALMGTSADFDALVTRAHGLGLRVGIDVVAGYTGDEHAWFRDAVAGGPGSPARRRYLFADGEFDDRSADGEQRPPQLPPGLDAALEWAPVGDGGWYLCHGGRHRPCLNFGDDVVRADLAATLRFWADRGVDGFRIDASSLLTAEVCGPPGPTPARPPGGDARPDVGLGRPHRLAAAYRLWRAVLDTYDPPPIITSRSAGSDDVGTGQAWPPNASRQVYNTRLLRAPWDADAFFRAVTSSLADQRSVQDPAPTWVLSAHDGVRLASRLAARAGALDGLTIQEGRRRARAATFLALFLPGCAYLYQGEELGLPQVIDLTADGDVRRDGGHVPMPWTGSGPCLGFSGGPVAVTQPASFAALSVQAQDDDLTSTLTVYRVAVHARRLLKTVDSSVRWLGRDDREVLHARRSNGWECIVNFSGAPRPMPAGRVLLTSDGRIGPTSELRPGTAAWLVAPGRTALDLPLGRVTDSA